MKHAPAALATWLVEPVSADVSRSVERLRRAPDVRQVCLMPDVHLAHDVCIGAVVVTERLIYPAAVGGDIGCGMAAVAFDAEACLVDDQRSAAAVLSSFYDDVPSNRHAKPRDLPISLSARPLSRAKLAKQAAREGRVQLGTLGRGNHFLELQSDLEGRLWAMVHSGSRGMGQSIAQHHGCPSPSNGKALNAVDAETESGREYLADVAWARCYAEENRLAILRAVEHLMRRRFRVTMDWSTLIHCDHNHVQQEMHFGSACWVHRKGAQAASCGQAGIVPGSMGTESFHVVGRGFRRAFDSCAHGAGRRLSRSKAQRISPRDFSRQMKGKWYDQRISHRLVEEAPSAYKDVGEVMRAQRKLVRIVRRLVPLLTYKGV